MSKGLNGSINPLDRNPSPRIKKCGLQAQIVPTSTKLHTLICCSVLYCIGEREQTDRTLDREKVQSDTFLLLVGGPKPKINPKSVHDSQTRTIGFTYSTPFRLVVRFSARIPTPTHGLFLTARHDRGQDLLVSRYRELSLVRRVFVRPCLGLTEGLSYEDAAGSTTYDIDMKCTV